MPVRIRRICTGETVNFETQMTNIENFDKVLSHEQDIYMISQLSSQLKEMNSNENLNKLVLGSVGSANSKREKMIQVSNTNTSNAQELIENSLRSSALSKDKETSQTSK